VLVTGKERLKRGRAADLKKSIKGTAQSSRSSSA
jgi:hypothetical protein